MLESRVTKAVLITTNNASENASVVAYAALLSIEAELGLYLGGVLFATLLHLRPITVSYTCHTLGLLVLFLFGLLWRRGKHVDRLRSRQF